MRSRGMNLLAGIVLLAVAGYFILRGVEGWKSPWQSQAAAKPARSFDPTTGDAAIRELVRTKVVSPLADSAAETPAGQTQSDGVETPAPAASDAPIDHVFSADSAPLHLLHKQFAVTQYHGFAFVVPAHAFQPRLHGSFRSRAIGGRRNAEIIVQLMNEDEFAAFKRGEDNDISLSTNVSDRGEVDWALNSPLEAQKYYLIFRGATAGKATRMVDADFTLISE